MTAQQLKNSILQMAVQGKLVPQDPNDEPASVLVERIRKEKEQLIKDKKIKKEKNSSFIFRGADNLPYEKFADGTVKCIADEVPFDIPDSWEWVRLVSIGQLQTGTTPSTNNPNYFNGKIPFIKPADIINESICYENESLTELGSQKSRLINRNSVIMVCIGGSMGKCATNIKDICCNQQINAVTPYLINHKYLMHVMCSDYLQNTMRNNSGGTATPIYNKSMWGELFIPLPPLIEQERIVAKLEEVLPQIGKYDIAHSKIEELNSNFPEQLKKSILQWAVQGKLVPQDPSDEPASALLERIHTEKKQLVKDKKIKKDKQESIIFKRDNSHYELIDGIEKCIDDEIPFDIPDSWMWCRLGSICNISNGFTPLKSNEEFWNSKDIAWFTVNDINNQGRIITYTEKFISKQALSKNSNRIIPKNSFLLCCTASIGEYAFSKIELTTNQQFNAIFPKPMHENAIDAKYLFAIGGVFKNILLNIAGKTTFPFVSTKKVSNILLPLPPLNEQRRIVKKIEQLLSLNNKL